MLLIVGVGDIYYSSIYHVERYCDSTIHHGCLIIGFMPCVLIVLLGYLIFCNDFGLASVRFLSPVVAIT